MASALLKAAPLTPAERQQRLALIRDIEADLRLEGLQIPQDAQPAINRFISGELNATQFRAEILHAPSLVR